MILQRTIKAPVTVGGVGIHSGNRVEVTLLPGAPNQGVVFIRKDLADQPVVSAHYKNVLSTQLATTIGRGTVSVSTVEHLLAALAGMGVDNVMVEVGGPEVPIMDGSSAPFVAAIKEVGLQTQLVPRKFLKLLRRVEVKVGEKWAVAEPCNHLEIHSSIDWDHPSIGFQELFYDENKSSFEEIASARTFGFMRDLELLREKGLARGASLENAVGLDEFQVLNPEGLRMPDEFVRHKVLDALGDFKLAGLSFQAKFRLHRSGHDLHNQILMEIFKSTANYQIYQPSREELVAPSKIGAVLAARAGRQRVLAP